MFLLVLISGFITFTLCSARQYVFVNENKTWTEAQSYCRDKYTDLATIENEQETIQLLNTVNDFNSIDLAWIGLYDDLNSWKWTLGDTDFFKGGDKQFRNWYHSEPAIYRVHICVYMFNGIWYPTYCFNTYTFICYDGRQNANTSYVLVNQYKNWTEAQSYCREHHTDLVSIRNESENQEIQYILQNNYDSVWIGLHRSSSWSDQSNSTFSNWRSGQPDNAAYSEYCTAVSFIDGKWTDENCDLSLPFFCYNGE
nr:macrophage mannose receptor 1-like [Misgurnus anguillicaudatus]